MSNTLVPYHRNLPPGRQASRALSQYAVGLLIVPELTRRAMDEVSDIHRYGANKVATTLADVEMSKQFAGDISPEQKAYFEYANSTYLRTMARIVATTTQRIALSLDEIPLHIDNRSSGRKFVDDILDVLV